ncbi:KEOPS complex subunit Cgi121 [Thermoplasma volcanium]|nr:KEOPS complex subunit Cgi121 [Thermoplasma volcanium]
MSHKVVYFKIKYKIDINKIVGFIRSTKNLFQLIDGRCLLSQTQILSAISRAGRRYIKGSRVNNEGILILMFVSASTQIDSAISSCGLKPDSSTAALIYDDESDYSNFIAKFPEFVMVDPFVPYDVKDDSIFEKMSYVDATL